MKTENVCMARQNLDWSKIQMPEGDIKNNKYLNPQPIVTSVNSEGELKEFHHSHVATALENCLNEGYRPLFVPEFTDARIRGKASWWELYNTTTSMRATGKTRQGSVVVVYAHIPNYFSSPVNVRKAISDGLVEGAGMMPQSEFQKLVDAEDNKSVFVVDYDKLKDSKFGCINIDSALEHPQTIPFLGGEKIAETYLAKLKKEYETAYIKTVQTNDFNKNSPMGRLLSVGGSGMECDSITYQWRDKRTNDLDSCQGLDWCGRFLGVRLEKK